MRTFLISVLGYCREQENTGIDMSCPACLYNLSRLVHFHGETLWQGADDQVVVSLIRRNRSYYRTVVLSNSTHEKYDREIQIYYEHTKQLLPNSPAGNLWIDVQTARRCHLPWVTNVREVRSQGNVTFRVPSGFLIRELLS